MADYFVQKRKNGKYKADREKIKHVNAVLQLLEVMEKDERFALVKNSVGKEGGIRTMCDVIDHYIQVGEEKGVLIGFEKGRTEGRSEGEAKTIWALYASGMSPEEIAARLKKDVAEVKAAIQKYSLQ